MNEFSERPQPAPFTPDQRDNLIKELFYTGDLKGVERVIKGANLLVIMESFRGDPHLVRNRQKNWEKDTKMNLLMQYFVLIYKDHIKQLR